jgi:hypothetical protein
MRGCGGELTAPAQWDLFGVVRSPLGEPIQNSRKII